LSFSAAHRHHLQPPETWLCVLGGGGAVMVDKYGAKKAGPVALRCTGRAFGEEGVEKSDEPEMEAKNRGSAVQLHCKSSPA
jgi:hypothetical protein